MPNTIESKRSLARPASSALRKRDIPELENGDCLTRKEFHRRYLAMPHVRAELIEGVVYMSAAASKQHSQPLSLVQNILCHYVAGTEGVDYWPDATLFLKGETEIQPDSSLSISPAYGGHGSESDRYFNRSPELVVEIANSSASVDMNQKFQLYRQNGALEYLVHLVREPAVRWFVLKEGNYESLPIDKAGVIRSETFPGLWLNSKALIARDLQGMLKTLKKGLATREHSAFCKRLRATAATLSARKTR